MADSTYSGDATIIDGSSASTSTASAEIAGGVYNDAAANLSSGNAGFIRLTAARAMHTHLRDASGNAVGVVQETGSSAVYGLSVSGATPHDSVDSGNPLKIGGRASSSVPVAVSDADRVNAWFDTYGAQSVRITGAGSVVGVGTFADGLDLSYALSTRSGNMVWNGTGWDRIRGATTLADTLANPGLGLLQSQSFSMQFNGSTWDRTRGDTTGTWIVGPTAADAALTAKPVTIGARASSSTPTDMNADGDVVNLWANRKGALKVNLVNDAGTTMDGTNPYLNVNLAGTDVTQDVRLSGGSGNAVPKGEDEALGVVGSTYGLPIVGRSSASAPTSTSADNDAMTMWLSRFGAVNAIVRDTSGNAAFTTAAALSDTYSNGTVSAMGSYSLAMNALGEWQRIRTAPTADALGPLGFLASATLVYNGASWDRMRGDVNGGFIQGPGAHSAGPVGNPVYMGGYAADSAATPVSAGELVRLWLTLNGAVNTRPVHSDGTVLSTASGVKMLGATAADAAMTVAPVTVGGKASAAVPTAMSADGDVVDSWLDRNGRQVVAQKAGTATLSNVTSSATSVTVLAANTSRLGATVVNDSTQVLYLKMGATASSTSFSVKLSAGAYYEVPFGYTGVLDGIWASANGNARVTEIT